MKTPNQQFLQKIVKNNQSAQSWQIPKSSGFACVQQSVDQQWEVVTHTHTPHPAIQIETMNGQHSFLMIKSRMDAKGEYKQKVLTLNKDHKAYNKGLGELQKGNPLMYHQYPCIKPRLVFLITFDTQSMAMRAWNIGGTAIWQFRDSVVILDELKKFIAAQILWHPLETDGEVQGFEDWGFPTMTLESVQNWFEQDIEDEEF